MEVVETGVKHFTDSAFCLAADLGASADFTAITVMEHAHHSHVTIKGKKIKHWDEYLVRHLERLPLGLSYVEQIFYVKQMLARPPLGETCGFVLDESGVGRAVADLAVGAGLKPLRVVITGGDGQSAKGNNRWNVAKSLLISNLDARLHSGELKIAPALAEAGTLREELRNFRRSVSAAGRFSFEARSGQHDDIVLSVALAIWFFVGRPKFPTAIVSRYHFPTESGD